MRTMQGPFSPGFIADVMAAFPGDPLIAQLVVTGDNAIVRYICASPQVPEDLVRRALKGDEAARVEAAGIQDRRDQLVGLHARFLNEERPDFQPVG